MDEEQDRLYKADDGSALRFYWGTERNNAQSERDGRPIHDNVLFVEVFSPGSSQSSPVHWLLRRYKEGMGESAQDAELRNEEIIRRYPEQLKAFLANDENAELIGTPLTAVTFLDRAMVASLKEGKIFTVEALAALPDEKLRVLGLGARTIRDQAQAFIARAKGDAPTASLIADLANIREELNVLRTANEALTEENAKLAANQKEEAPPPPPPPADTKPVADTPEKPAKAKSSDLI